MYLHNDQDMGRLATKQTNEKARFSKIEMAHVCACAAVKNNILVNKKGETSQKIEPTEMECQNIRCLLML
jgi:hypothetical protein